MRSTFLSSAAFAIVVALGQTAPHAEDASKSLSPLDPPFLPVLVRVNSSGKISKVSPATTLSPDLTRQMDNDLEKIVTEPSVENYGRSFGQFVVNLALDVTPRPDGRFDAKFRMVSVDPVPAGEWYWVKINGWYSLSSESGLGVQ